MAKNPLRTKFTDMMGIEFPILAFTHCKDVVAAVVNAGGFAVLGEAMHTPDHIADDIKWIRSRVGDKPFGIDLVLPSSAPPSLMVTVVAAAEIVFWTVTTLPVPCSEPRFRVTASTSL
jgi:hypothetical protein